MQDLVSFYRDIDPETRAVMVQTLRIIAILVLAWILQVAAARLIRQLEVDVVLGTGGYVSAPAVLGARLAGRPALLLEPNARSGVANRWLSRCAAGTVVAFPETAREFKGRVWVTGVPIRGAFFAVPEALPPSPPLRLLVLGGSLGARRINSLVPEAVARLLPAIPGLTVLHQAGARNVDETRDAYARAEVQESVAEVVPFLDDVAGAVHVHPGVRVGWDGVHVGERLEDHRQRVRRGRRIGRRDPVREVREHDPPDDPP
mgnify:CR=1 FL=1